MKYDAEKIDAIQRTWLTPHWIPNKDLSHKAMNDVNYLISVIHELSVNIAELKNHVRFNTTRE